MVRTEGHGLLFESKTVGNLATGRSQSGPSIETLIKGVWMEGLDAGQPDRRGLAIPMLCSRTDEGGCRGRRLASEALKDALDGGRLFYAAN